MEQLAAMAIGMFIGLAVFRLEKWIRATIKDRSCRWGGHAWEFAGGRACPFYDDDVADCSQAAYKCRRCGAWDYGQEPGPGFDDCQSYCERSFEHDRDTAERQ